jgi:uronate dehydrogenase
VGDARGETLLVTGAAGRIGSRLREAWRGRFARLRLVDLAELGEAAPGEEVIGLGLEDFEAIRKAMQGVTVAVHLAAIPQEDTLPRLLDANVRATYNVFEAARQCGVRRVVFASTYHVTGFYPRDERVSAADPVRPDSMYAVTKVFGEAVGRLYADKWGLEVVCLRLGAFGERPQGGDMVGTWLSPRDMVQLLTRAVTVPGLRFSIVYGASQNRPSWWDNPGAATIGYQPVDEAVDGADGQQPRPATAGEMRQGGSYATREYWIEP